jgi:hypothetical protein
MRGMSSIRSAAAVVCGVLIAVLAGCGGGGGGYGGGNGGGSTSPVVGRWRLTKVQASGLTLNCPGSLNVPGVGSASCGDSDVVQYNSDGTFTATGNITVNGGGINFPGNGTGTGSASGTWQLSGDQLTVRVTQPPPTGSGSQTATATARFSGQNMTLTSTQNNVTVVTTFVKA